MPRLEIVTIQYLRCPDCGRIEPMPENEDYVTEKDCYCCDIKN